MPRPRFEVADVVRRYGPAFLAGRGAALAPDGRRVLAALAACRTARLGGHVDPCDRCEHRLVSYNSCRNRHCPKCQAEARAAWLEAREAELLPVDYFHLVFTLPRELAPLALQNPATVYGLLFRAGCDTLRSIASDPRHLGAKVGGLAVLHTWGQKLDLHPHLHCIVTGGGLAPDGARWIACRKRFFLPVRVLSRRFRRLFLDGLRRAFAEEQLRFHGRLLPLAEKVAFESLVMDLAGREWVVYAKPPFGGPRRVLAYLANYTHRVAISNHRLVDIGDGKVCFRYKDYARGARRGILTLDAHEFLRRFLLHVLPKGFVRIRHFGFLANRHRERELEAVRALLAAQATSQSIEEPCDSRRLHQIARTPLFPPGPPLCPSCRVGHLLRIDVVPPLARSPAPAPIDSS